MVEIGNIIIYGGKHGKVEVFVRNRSAKVKFILTLKLNMKIRGKNRHLCILVALFFSSLNSIHVQYDK